MMYKVPLDVIALPEAKKAWLLMNLFSRTSLAVESAVLEVIREAEKNQLEDMETKYKENFFSVWEVEWFSNNEGLLADPTRYKRNETDWPQEEKLKLIDLLERLKKHYLLVENENEYRKKFSLKESILDGKHFGNFHQQLGTELLLVQRKEASKWWLQQKFSKDLKGINNNLYKAVQEYYLKDYIKKRFCNSDRVLDIGCGIGYYTNLIAETGASVLGVDPNEEYINLAKSKFPGGARYEVMNVITSGAMDRIPSNSVDYVFMSDALLFYFVPFDPRQKADIGSLLNNVRRILKPNGIFISVEPHCIFWLLPWLGDNNRPFTVLTEYRNRFFGVTANMSQLINTFTKAGFVVSWMDEMSVDPSFEAVNSRAYYFAQQFPLWQIFEFMALDIDKKGLETASPWQYIHF